MHHLGSFRIQSFRIWSGSRGFLVQNLPGLRFQPRGYQRSRPTGAVATCHGLRDWHVLKNGVDLLKLPDFEMQELSSCKSREFRETPSLFRVRSKSKSRDRRRRVLWIGIGQRIGHYHAHRKGSGGGASCAAAEQSFCAKEAGAKQARVSRAQEDGVGRKGLERTNLRLHLAFFLGGPKPSGRRPAPRRPHPKQIATALRRNHPWPNHEDVHGPTGS